MSSYFKHGFMQALNYIYSDRSFLEPPLSNTTVNNARELVFSPLCKEIVKTVSPAIRPQPLEWLQGNIEEAVSKFANHNTRSKEYVCINGLYNAVGAKQFLKTLKLMRLQHKLADQISAATVNDYFGEILQDQSEMAFLEAMDMALLLAHHRNVDLYTPFVYGSWRLVDVLEKIMSAECKIAFDTFFSSASQNVKEQAYAMMHTTDSITGLLKYHWGYINMHNVVNVNHNNTLEEVPTSLDSDHLNLTRSVKLGELKVQIVDTIADIVYCLKLLKRCMNSREEQQLLAVHVEQDTITVATAQTCLVIDMLVTDPLYKSAVFNLLSWIWANSKMVKVGHRILPKIAKTATIFDRPFNSFVNIVDLNNKRKKVLENSIVQFKSAGISRTLNGLLQEYATPYIYERKRWNLSNRPISDDRMAYMASVANGMLSIEHKLREEGWMPTDIYDVEHQQYGNICEQLEEEIHGAQL